MPALIQLARGGAKLHKLRMSTNVVLVIFSAACGGGDRSTTPLAVTLDGPVAPYAPDYLSAPDLAERVSAVVADAARVWGASAAALDGYRIALEQRPFDCGRDGVTADHIIGCTWLDRRLIQVLALGSGCPEATVIAHEVGHAVIGDSGHSDPRWRDQAFWARMLDAMKATAPPGCALEHFVAMNEVADGEG